MTAAAARVESLSPRELSWRQQKRVALAVARRLADEDLILPRGLAKQLAAEFEVAVGVMRRWLCGGGYSLLPGLAIQRRLRELADARGVLPKGACADVAREFGVSSPAITMHVRRLGLRAWHGAAS